MPEEDRYDRGSTLTVARGLHVFRYVSFQGAGIPAVARLISPGPAVTVLDMPGRERGMLQRPGDCLVLRANRTSDVVVGLRRGGPDSSLDASFRLEPIVLADAPAQSEAAIPDTSAEDERFYFVAHLANIGDTKFAQGVWAGGPDRPAAIEGLQIVAEAGAPALEMQVLVGSRPPRWSEWVGVGQFAGTRGHNLPLVGVRLRMRPEAANQEIVAEALFLGALVAAQRGRQVEFVSASGVDPLVGVKFTVRPSLDLTERNAGASESPQRDRESRVRVFRASAAR